MSRVVAGVAPRLDLPAAATWEACKDACVPTEPTQPGHTSGALLAQPEAAISVRVTSRPEIVIIDDRPEVVVLDDRPALVTVPVATSRADRRPRRRGLGLWGAAVWTLGVAEGILIVGGLLVLYSCRFLTSDQLAQRRADLGIAMLLAGAFLSVPATVLIAERPSTRRRDLVGRHRRT